MTVEESSPSSVFDALSKMALSRGMSASSIEQLSQIGEIKSYPAGCLIFSESEYHGRLHILCSGMVTLGMRVQNHGVEKILTLGSGEFLAWSALLADGIMTTSAVVTQDTVAVEFSAHDLKALCDQNHELGYHMMRQVAIALSRRLLATRLQLLDLFRDCA